MYKYKLIAGLKGGDFFSGGGVLMCFGGENGVVVFSGGFGGGYFTLEVSYEIGLSASVEWVRKKGHNRDGRMVRKRVPK